MLWIIRVTRSQVMDTLGFGTLSPCVLHGKLYQAQFLTNFLLHIIKSAKKSTYNVDVEVWPGRIFLWPHSVECILSMLYWSIFKNPTCIFQIEFSLESALAVKRHQRRRWCAVGWKIAPRSSVRILIFRTCECCLEMRSSWIIWVGLTAHTREIQKEIWDRYTEEEGCEDGGKLCRDGTT